VLCCVALQYMGFVVKNGQFMTRWFVLWKPLCRATQGRCIVLSLLLHRLNDGMLVHCLPVSANMQQQQQQQQHGYPRVLSGPLSVALLQWGCFCCNIKTRMSVWLSCSSLGHLSKLSCPTLCAAAGLSEAWSSAGCVLPPCHAHMCLCCSTTKYRSNCVCTALPHPVCPCRPARSMGCSRVCSA
jgi:hypothetical protein